MRNLPEPVRVIYEDYQRSVVPLGPDKRPFEIDGQRLRWKEFQNRLPSQEQLVGWLERNVPIWAQVTGRLSKVITFDFDGEKGAATMRDLQLVPHRRTGSGGYHVDVVYPGYYVPTLNGKTLVELQRRWPGLDFRGDGVYAAIWGRSNAGPYEQLRDPTPDPGDAIPEEVWTFLRQHCRQAIRQPVQHPPQSPVTDLDERSRLILDRALGMARTTGRNNAGLWLACQLRDNGMSQSQAESVMEAFASRVPSTNFKGDVENYSFAEALSTVKSAYSRPAREPWSERANVMAPGIFERRALSLVRRMVMR